MGDHPEHFHDHDGMSHLPSDPALRAKALESLLVEKGLVRPETIEAIIDQFEHSVGPHNGARVVAKSWIDKDYRQRLQSNATKAIGELGLLGQQSTDFVAVENSESVHNIVVCTLCSCYPWTVLGLPPAWYKSYEYRSRVVREPRKVLQEFGVEVPEHREVRVWDSTAEIRYLVIPQRPPNTEHMSEEELAGLVSRDAMIGAAQI